MINRIYFVECFVHRLRQVENMRQWWKRLGSIRSLIPIFASCIAILANFENARTKLESALGYISPIASAFLFPIVVSVISYIVLRALLSGFGWFHDRWNDGPARRAFAAKYRIISNCKNDLISLDNQFAMLHSNSPELIADFAAINGNMALLTRDLEELGIFLPSADIANVHQRLRLLRNLAGLETFAISSDIGMARKHFGSGRGEP